MESFSLIHTAKIFIQENPVLTALLIFAILVLDTIYVYRTLRRFLKKPSCRPLGLKAQENQAEKNG